MSKAIWKYEVPIADEFSLPLPGQAQVLSVQVQRGVPCLWVLVNPKARSVPRRFRLFGTGNPVDETDGRFVGTFQIKNGALVFHLFEMEQT